MTTAIDVAKYIRSRMNLNGEVQLQKLVYYVQAWSLAWDGRPMFDEPIEAWRMGPVVRSLRYRMDPADATALSDEQRATVDAVVEFYGRHHGGALIDMTHAERPWADVWESRPEGHDRCDDEITHEAMRRFYTKLALTSRDVPSRNPVARVASSSEAMQVAAANAERWRETLAILAQ